MKKFLKLFLAVICGLVFLNTSVLADPVKGQKIYIRNLKDVCGMDGGTMAKKHTQAEWKTMYDSGKLNDELIKKCPDAKPLKDNHLQDVYDFLFNYASDSGNVPSC